MTTPSPATLQAARDALHGHMVCDDCWYSCPLSGDCCNDAAPKVCTCGRDRSVEAVAHAMQRLVDDAVVAVLAALWGRYDIHEQGYVALIANDLDRLAGRELGTILAKVRARAHEEGGG